MKIVLLDTEPALGSSRVLGSAAEDLDLTELRALGSVVSHRNTGPEKLLEHAGDADVLVVNKVRLFEAEFAALPSLRLVSVLATGTDNVDLGAAARHGIVVSNVPGYSTDSAAQHTFALILELTSQVGLHAEDVRKGNWSRAPSFSYWQTPLIELAGLTLGIIGYGTIGRRVTQIAEGFGMRVLISSRTPSEGDARFVTRDELLANSDIVSLHVPLTADTRRLMGEEALARMKPGALLINVARGGLLDEQAVRAALESGHLGALGADVLSEEPPRSDHPLVNAPRALITPHIAWATRAARSRLLARTIENIRAFLAGRPENVVGAR